MLRSVAADPAPSRSARRLEREEGVPVQIAVVGPADLAELQPLMRAYCDFCQVAPGDQTLLELSQALLADPQPEGLQLLARDDTGRAVGFATLFWTWQTAVDNHRAQAVCERIGATRDDRWLDYQLPVDPG
jgi:hypothetical protein